MSSFYISTDGTCDMPRDIVESWQDYVIIPQDFSIAGKDYSYFGENCLPIAEFYRLIDSGELASTSQVQPARFEQYWTPILEQGHDILHISFASALSGSYNNSVSVAAQLAEKYPERKIVTIDSRNATGSVGLLTMFALQKRDSGATFDETVDYLREIMPYMNTWFTIDTLKHLLRMGRLSKSAAILGTVMQIKPVLTVTADGSLKQFDKVMGRMTSFKRLVQTYKSKYDPSVNVLYIGHSGNFADVEFLEQKIREFNPDVTIIKEYVGAIAGSHTGTGMTVLCFKGTELRPDLQ